MDIDLIEILRQVASSPSPLAELVSDPILLKRLTRSPKGEKTRASGSHSGNRKRSRDTHSSDTVFSVVLAEEERQVQYLKSMLRSTGERLQNEIRRAEDAESAAQLAQSRERDAAAKIVLSEQARYRSELDNARLQEEIKRYTMQIDMMQKQVEQAQDEIKTLSAQREEAEEAAAKARETARQYKQALSDTRAREEGREEGRRMGLMRGYSDGQLEGWQTGRQEGFEEGRTFGKVEGKKEGEKEGRTQERKRALQEFDRFVVDHGIHTEERGRDRRRQAERWTGSVEQEEYGQPIPVERSSSSLRSRPDEREYARY